MTPDQFCYWLQGCLEMNPDLAQFTPEQTQMIRQHLEMVFVSMPKEVNPRQSVVFPPTPTSTQGSSILECLKSPSPLDVKLC